MRYVAVMRGQQMQAAARRTPFAEEAVARFPRRFLDTCCGLFTRPDQHRMRNAARGEPAADGRDLRGAFRSQPVVDNETPSRATTLPRPTIGKDHQGQAIGTTRYADRDQGPRLKPIDSGKRGVEFRKG
jgi:hypothetical protein